MKQLITTILPIRKPPMLIAVHSVSVMMIIWATARAAASFSHCSVTAFRGTLQSTTCSCFIRRYSNSANRHLQYSKNSLSPSATGVQRLWASTSIPSTESNNTTTTATDVSSLTTTTAKEQRYQAARAKRKQKYVGMAKAVDHGQPGLTTYQPLQADTGTFVAKSGLPGDINSKKALSFTVLGIESSCDDTGAAVVRSDGVILGESLASQHDIHEAWGGVVPNLARDAHQQQIDRVVEEALERANMTMDDVDAVGVTVGPGLEICLRVGCNKARTLALQYQKPFVGIHHLEAHILMARMPVYNNVDNLNKESQLENPQQLAPRAIDFPFLALLVSGGHCQLLKCLGIGQYSILGGTIDDSLGEAYDKTARLLGLPVGGGGGPAIEKLAKEGNPKALTLTIPLRQRQDCDFSFAGLKTGVRLAAEKLCQERGVDLVLNLTRQDKADIAASFQNVAIKHVEQKWEKAMTMLEPEGNIRSLAVVGGVAANSELRSRLEAICATRSWSMFVPPPRLCTDQGAMSAWAAIERLSVGSSDDPTNQEVYARYPFSLLPPSGSEN